MADRVQWILLGVLVVGPVLLALLFGPSIQEQVLDPRLSTFRATPDGALALYLTLEELGIPVDRRETPLSGAEPVGPALAVLAPTETPTPRDVGAALEAVRAGGMLLWVAHPWVPFMEGGGALGDSLGLAVGLAGLGELRMRRHPWTAGLRPPRELSWAFFRPEEGWPPGAELLVASGDTLAMALVIPRGRGRVVAFADEEWLSNADAAGSGTAALFARAAEAATAGGDPLVFAEYYHGFAGGSVREGVLRFLTAHPAGWTTLQLGVLALLALFAAGRRFGAPLPPRVTLRRSPLEHAEALAQVYGEARARRTARLLLLAGLARQMRRPRPAGEADALRFVEGLAPVAPRSAEALGRLADGLRRGEGDVLPFAMDVDRVREELLT